ncbi:52 kDa repressor of the inhibitor of the protein kinase-like [Hydra vulgaris]|uniref:52 kDa repressor of the inhibitor of the protein kinase-like n=1 Tax=Hydra vulgaris TaxID=6087 RepID=A0ABM4CLS8_HYDVU
MKFCVGQVYDGPGNMAGRYSGSAITTIYPKALYVHCGSHVFNLCVADACKLQLVSNMMANVRIVSQFFNFSPKRFDILKKKNRRNVSRTLSFLMSRFWKHCHLSLLMINNEEKSWNHDSVRDANSYFFATSSFQFIVTLVVVSCSLEITRPNTKQFQSPNFDVLASHEKVPLLYDALQRLRSDIDDDRSGSWYSEIVVLAASVGVNEHKPCIIGNQLNRNSSPCELINKYYKNASRIPFLYHLSFQIQLRFSNRNISVYNGFFAMLTNVLNVSEWRKNFILFLNEYEVDLP